MQNLNKEIRARNIKKPELANVLGITLASLYNKLNGQSKFTIYEAMAIKNIYFKDLEYEYLFAE